MFCQSNVEKPCFHWWFVHTLWKSKINNWNKYIFPKNHSRGKYKRHIAPAKICLSLVFFHYLFPFTCHSPVYILCLKWTFLYKPHVHTIMWLASRKYFLKMLFYVGSRDQMPHLPLNMKIDIINMYCSKTDCKMASFEESNVLATFVTQ